MGKKFKKRAKPELMAQVRATKTKVSDKRDEALHSEEQQLSSTDKLVWAYKNVKIKGKIVVTEIVTVSYVTKIKGKEYTVIYYDSTHDKILHMHIYKSIYDSSDIVVPLPIRKKGNQSKLLSWAIKDIRNKWDFYRKKCWRSSFLFR